MDPFTIAALALSGLSVGSSVVAQSRQRDVERRQDAIRSAQQTRSNLASIREASIRRAQIRAAAGVQGTQESSPVQGAQGAVQSVASGNVAFTKGISNLQNAASFSAREANRFQSLAGAFGSGANIFGNLEE